MSKKEILIGILILLSLFGFIKKDFLFEELPKKIINKNAYKEANLRIVTNTPATDLSEYSLDLNNLIRTANIYEGLVAFDRNLKIIPALATSWGNINNTTWEFKLRKEVKFHDKAKFDANSVKQSFSNAIGKGGSQVKSLLSTIKEIKIKDPYTIQIITKKPDPLILSKLTQFRISRSNKIGTGPYVISEWKKGQKLALKGYSDYWGKLPIYQHAEYIVTKDKNKRQNDYDNGKIDLLLAVPKENAMHLPPDRMKHMFSLEVNFLMFNLKNPLLSQRKIRDVITKSFDPRRIEDIGNGLVRQVSQFIPPGVYGHNPEIPLFEYREEEKKRDIFGKQKKQITLDYLPTFKTLAEYIKSQLNEAGFSTRLNPLDATKLLEKIKSNKSQLYILGWQAENGDAQGFLDAFVHSKGQFNNGRYVNAEVDKLIEKARQEINPTKRIEILKNTTDLVHKDLIGIPLFEASRVYAAGKNIKWEPRMDGLVLASDVK